MYSIQQLQLEEFHLCCNIWNMEQNRALADRFYSELISRNRITFVCNMNGVFVGEISLVHDMHDDDYTISGQRIYLSRLMVKQEYRRRGIGTALSNHVFRYAKGHGYTEMALGVDLDNYAALKLYSGLGFLHITLVDKDSQGPYLKLLKYL